MSKFLNTLIGRLRTIAFFEGLSLLLLLFVAMPLKYIYNKPLMVENVGMVHGILFMIYVAYTLYVHFSRNWDFKRITWKVLAASVLPFGTFYIDSKILSKLPQ